MEIVRAFAPETPDAVFVPVSSGGHANGIWKAFREVHEAGLVDELPALYFVQACAPIAEVWERGDETVTPVEAGKTAAYSIANASSPAGTACSPRPARPTMACWR